MYAASPGGDAYAYLATELHRCGFPSMQCASVGAVLARFKHSLSPNARESPVSSKIPDPYVPLKEAARFLNLTPATIRAMCDRGDVEFIRDSNDTRRVLLSSLMKWAEERKKEATRKARERRATMDARQKRERQA